MKKILFTVLVSCFSVVYSQNLNFTDSKFKALILSSNSTNGIAKNLSGNSIAIDANGDGEIQTAEAQQVVILDVKMDETQKIDAATGEINFPYYFAHLPDNITDALLFTNVKELYISDTKNANISFINNNKITKLACMNRWYYDEASFNGNFYESYFFDVDFTIDNCPSILTMNDINAFYHPYFLGQTIFRIKNNPQFNGALVMNDILVSELYMENIDLTSIKIDDCRGLVKLSVPNITTLQTINITNTQNASFNQEINLIANNCTSLHEVILDGDYYDSYAVYITAINVNGCSSLKKLKGLNASNIDFSTAALANLEELDCAYYNRYLYTANSLGSVILGNVTSLNLTGLPKLKKLTAFNQPLNYANINVSPLLQEVNIVTSIQFLSNLDVSNLTALHTLKANNGAPEDSSIPINLQNINAQNCTALADLEIWGNYDLKTLNLQNCSSLQTLSISDNILYNYFTELNTLNLLQCSGLQELYIKYTKISSLDISDCTGLKKLDLIENNFLNQLNISNNVNLEELHIEKQPLIAQLNTLNNVNLKNVFFKECPLLTQLDFSTASHLESFSALDNLNLVSVNVHNNSIEQYVENYNHNPSLSVCVDDAQLASFNDFDINFTSDCTNLIKTIWNGTTWSNGVPTSAINAFIAGNYSTTTHPMFTAKNIIVNNGAVLEITSGNTINAADVTIKNGGNLIQRDGSTLNYTGDFSVKKYSKSDFDKYAFWSSPVALQDLNTIYGTGITPQFITEYNTATDNFVNAASTTSAFGKGYSIKTPSGSTGTLTFTGVPNNGTQTYNLATTGNRFNLVGNPYPSNLDLDSFYIANQGRISNTLYFWDNTSNSVTTQGGATSVNIGYATYNASTSAWVPAPNTNTAIPTGNIANIGQGFFVRALSAPSDTSLSFTNDMRTATSGTFFNKNNSSTEGKFWLKLNSSYNTNNTIAVAYLNSASDAFDQYDSKAIGMGSDAFYTMADAQKLVIQGKAGFDITDIVPVGTKHFQNANFTISLVQKEGIFNNGQAIYLHDKDSGTYTNLQNAEYSFTNNAGEFANRFEIVYKLDVLATAEATRNSFEVYREGDDFLVRNDKNIETVEVFDVAGRKVLKINSNAKLVRIKIDAKGVYFLKAVSAGKEYSKKIIK
ncbi:T9SS type A sorting domain-containing protein [Chryseobacterium wangxinyae]|uniref:T9SS type A sorting domain-containing protein n=2 Tax=Chryseobacterium sp. CY350 TaxID=2997336 RepID=UPI0022FD606E|nr:T9SS type A sorting domain-containing protein [Chryseobacterium sp. CY350]WBZ97159.1 T9SS type A sorting domain-containing protein [Chryseobacterium sp. CY350]